VCIGFWAVEVVGSPASPKSHNHDVGDPVELSKNWTATVAEAVGQVNAAVGGGAVGGGAVGGGAVGGGAVGGGGVAPAVIGFDGSDGRPVPSEFFAVTVNVYVTPSTRPATPQLVVVVVLHPKPAGSDFTSYPVTGFEPAGFVHMMSAEFNPVSVAVTPVG
jgi:hypothetical protein